MIRSQPPAKQRMESADASIDILSKPGFRRRDPEEAFNNLSRILKTIKDCPIPQFKSQRVIEILAKYSTPEGAKQGNAILPERTVYDHWQTIYSGACITSIFNIIIRFQATSSWKDIVPHLIAAWPSTQIALQLHGRLLFDKNRPQFSLGVVITRMNAFNSIVTLIQGYSLHNPLADLVRKTPAAVDMVIKLWGLEVRDAEIQAGLTTAFPTGFVIPPGASISSTVLPWLDAATLKSWTQLLCDELPKYMIYISVLRLTHKSLASIRSLGLNKRLRGAAADSWAAFQAHVDKCSEFAPPRISRKQDLAAGRIATRMGPSCAAGASRRPTAPAPAKSPPGAGTKPHVKHAKVRAVEDIEFACKIAQAGFEGRRTQMRRELAAKRPAAPILIELDYTVFPPALKVSSLPAPLPFPTVRPIVMFHADFPKGRARGRCICIFCSSSTRTRGARWLRRISGEGVGGETLEDVWDYVDLSKLHMSARYKAVESYQKIRAMFSLTQNEPNGNLRVMWQMNTMPLAIDVDRTLWDARNVHTKQCESDSHLPWREMTQILSYPRTARHLQVHVDEYHRTFASLRHNNTSCYYEGFHRIKGLITAFKLVAFIAALFAVATAQNNCLTIHKGSACPVGYRVCGPVEVGVTKCCPKYAELLAVEIKPPSRRTSWPLPTSREPPRAVAEDQGQGGMPWDLRT
ncbi:hypothetical protein B0H13DRAFT_1868359 [Mycena leptocephala]|nr:hypothetical protein B0H13DRAFT_1868359 [Mycena leptocephala]